MIPENDQACDSIEHQDIFSIIPFEKLKPVAFYKKIALIRVNNNFSKTLKSFLEGLIVIRKLQR